MTQCESMLAALREAGPRGLSALELLHKVGTLRASARAWDLRREGHEVRCEKRKGEDGEIHDYYVLVEDRVQYGQQKLFASV